MYYEISGFHVVAEKEKYYDESRITAENKLPVNNVLIYCRPGWYNTRCLPAGSGYTRSISRLTLI